MLVTTLTKRMAEDLTEYFTEIGVRCRYLHSEVETLDRIKILRDLRRGEFDVLIGINLLREGLDLPEVSLVAILDADKEGYLRSATSLIQTMGRCARHIEGRAILYADRRTDSMNQAIDETNRRRAKQRRLQQGKQHHAAIHHQVRGHGAGAHRRSRLRDRAAGRGRTGCGRGEHRDPKSNWRKCCSQTRNPNARSRQEIRIRESRAAARPHPLPKATRPGGNVRGKRARNPPPAHETAAHPFRGEALSALDHTLPRRKFIERIKGSAPEDSAAGAA